MIDAGVGVQVTTSGTLGMLTPSIYNDGIIGNTEGLVINDAGSTPVDDPACPGDQRRLRLQHDRPVSGQHRDLARARPMSPAISSGRTTTRPTLAMVSPSYSENVNKVTLQNNLFYGNGASDTNQSSATNDLGNGFSPALLGTTAAAAAATRGTSSATRPSSSRSTPGPARMVRRTSTSTPTSS